MCLRKSYIMVSSGLYFNYVTIESNRIEYYVM